MVLSGWTREDEVQKIAVLGYGHSDLHTMRQERPYHAFEAPRLLQSYTSRFFCGFCTSCLEQPYVQELFDTLDSAGLEMHLRI